jgi:drug/metabolite transporter (DMT)-like permease
MKRSVISFIFAMLLAGTIGVFVTQSGLDSLTAVFFRCLIAALCLGTYGLYRGLFSRTVFQSGELRYIIVAGIALVINWVLIFQAFRLSSITIGIASYYTEPFFLIALGVVLLKEKFNRSTLMWTFLAFIGLLLIILNNQQTSAASSTILPGIACALAAAFFYALATIMGKKVVKTSPVVMTFIQMLIGTLLLFPLANIGAALTHNTGWGYILTLGAVHTAFLYVLFYQSVRDVPTTLIAPLSFLDPLVAILSDVILYSTLLSSLQIVGIITILVAAYFVSKTVKPQPTIEEIAK